MPPIVAIRRATLVEIGFLGVDPTEHRARGGNRDRPQDRSGESVALARRLANQKAQTGNSTSQVNLTSNARANQSIAGAAPACVFDRSQSRYDDVAIRPREQEITSNESSGP